jgi:hypothetical protein
MYRIDASRRMAGFNLWGFVLRMLQMNSSVAADFFAV